MVWKTSKNSKVQFLNCEGQNSGSSQGGPVISGQASTMKGVAHKLQEIPERREDFYWIGAVHQQHWGKLKKGRLGGGCGEDMVMHTYNSSTLEAEAREL
jgi:hypothetical protein